MSEFHPGPEPAPFDRRELYENNPVFRDALTYQRGLDDLRFNDFPDAAVEAHKLATELDKFVVESNLLHEMATLIGPDVTVPKLAYHESSGSAIIRSVNSRELEATHPGINGEFWGFVGYALPSREDPDMYVPTLGIQVLLRKIHAPNFSGNLTAYGPVVNTSVEFVADSLTKFEHDHLF